MKIKKLTESVILTEEDLNPIKGTDAEATTAVISGAESAGVNISQEAAKNEVAEAKKTIEKFVLNPYSSTADQTEVEQKLQRCLEAAYSAKQSGIDEDYPDMLIFGLAGFGKTASVKKFCKAHGIYPLELDASTLRPEGIAGLPKVMADEDGNEFQAYVPTAVWRDLKNHEQVILIVDEVNRSKPNVTDMLNKLICDHDIPVPYKDENGVWHSKQHFDNILFTVAMINPASRDLFQDVHELDPALVNRFGKQHEATPDKRSFLNVVKKIYNIILANPALTPEMLKKYQGQLDILEALLKNSGFSFSDRDETVLAHKAQRTEFRPRNALSYRSLLKIVRMCDGTKADFIKQVQEAGFLEQISKRITNCLSTYTDKVSKGNSVFQKTAATPEQSAKAAADINDTLKTFEASLI